jgi:transposase
MAGSGDEVLDFGKGSAPVCGEVGGVAGLAALILHLGADGGKGGPKDGAEDVGRRGGGASRSSAMSRQRQQLVRERQRLAAMGRSLLAMHNIHVTGRWWKGKAWARIKAQAPGWVVERLEVNIAVIVAVEAHEVKLTGAIQEAGRQKKIPRGVGPLTFEVLRREVGDWSRFNNRRQVSSYTGLCPREHSSGGKRRTGSVSKSGNPRIRAMLVEMVWRMIRWQPDYQPLKKWEAVFKNPTATSGAKKKAVVAIARQLAVDLWRVFTGQTPAEKFGLIYQADAA